MYLIIYNHLDDPERIKGFLDKLEKRGFREGCSPEDNDGDAYILAKKTTEIYAMAASIASCGSPYPGTHGAEYRIVEVCSEDARSCMRHLRDEFQSIRILSSPASIKEFLKELEANGYPCRAEHKKADPANLRYSLYGYDKDDGKVSVYGESLTKEEMLPLLSVLHGMCRKDMLYCGHDKGSCVPVSRLELEVLNLSPDGSAVLGKKTYRNVTSDIMDKAEKLIPATVHVSFRTTRDIPVLVTNNDIGLIHATGDPSCSDGLPEFMEEIGDGAEDIRIAVTDAAGEFLTEWIPVRR